MVRRHNQACEQRAQGSHMHKAFTGCAMGCMQVFVRRCTGTGDRQPHLLQGCLALLGHGPLKWIHATGGQLAEVAQERCQGQMGGAGGPAPAPRRYRTPVHKSFVQGKNAHCRTLGRTSVPFGKSQAPAVAPLGSHPAQAHPCWPFNSLSCAHAGTLHVEPPIHLPET